jgi:excisionase family DNA binding protein
VVAKEDKEMVINNQYGILLTSSEVARMLNVHINTVRRWENDGMLRALRLGTRGDRRFTREEISRYLGQLNGNRHMP